MCVGPAYVCINHRHIQTQWTAYGFNAPLYLEEKLSGQIVRLCSFYVSQLSSREGEILYAFGLNL
jgi:hypothetical protein